MSLTWNPIMVEGTANGNGRKRLFEPIFNLGSVIMIIGSLTGGVAAFYSVKEDLSKSVEHQLGVERLLSERTIVVDKRLDTLQSGIDTINGLIIRNLPSRYSRDDATKDFGQINTRLDGHEQRIQRLETRPR